MLPECFKVMISWTKQNWNQIYIHDDLSKYRRSYLTRVIIDFVFVAFYFVYYSNRKDLRSFGHKTKKILSGVFRDRGMFGFLNNAKIWLLFCNQSKWEINSNKKYFQLLISTWVINSFLNVQKCFHDKECMFIISREVLHYC